MQKEMKHYKLLMPIARIILGKLILLLFCLGCGNKSLFFPEANLFQRSQENPIKEQSQSNENTETGNKPITSEPVASFCKSFEVPLFERPIRMMPRSLELTSVSSLTLESPQLMADAGLEKRCEEIEKNFSGAVSVYNGGLIRRMSLFVFKFEPTHEQENQLKNGELIAISPKKVSIELTDGEHYHRRQEISLRCPDLFEITCKNRQRSALEKCDTFDVTYPDQVCMLQAKSLPYMFSDQQSQVIDLAGEIKLSKQSGSLFIVNWLRW